MDAFERLKSVSISYLSSENNWIFQILLVVISAFFLSYVLKRILSETVLQLQKTKTPWDELVVQSARKPVSWLIWLLAITFSIDIFNRDRNLAVLEILSPLRDTGVIIILALFLLSLVKAVQEILTENQKNTPQKKYDTYTIDAVSKLARISIFIVSGLILLQTMGYSVSGVLAFGGIGGIAVGFAAKDLLSNFFGGLMIYLDRPFKVGDWIRSSDRDIEGTVEQIGWRLTQIRNFDARPVYIPNSIFNTISLENPSRMTNRKIYETFGIRYQDVSKMEIIVKEVRDLLENHPEIDKDTTIMANFTTLSPSSVDFFIYTFTKTTNSTEYYNAKQEILLSIITIIENHDAELAFPTSTLHLETRRKNPAESI